MQQTDNYKLNLIETSDPFSPNPLNANTEVLDRVMAAVEREQHLFKLAEASLPEQNGPLAFDLSGVDITQYGALLLICCIRNSMGIHFMTINDTGSVAVIYANSSDKRKDQLAATLFIPVADSVVAMGNCLSATVDDPGTSSGSVTGGRFETPWQDIRTIAFKGTNVNVGSGGVMFGIKF